MIIDGKLLKSNTDIQAEVCILGGGVAGIILARELSNTFKQIIIIESGEEQYSEDSQALYAVESKPKYFPDPKYSRLRFLGGTSNHWENNTSPLDPIDFEKRSWIPNSGWPISFEDIEPYYKKAARYCGTMEDGYDANYWAKTLNAPDILKISSNLETGISKNSIPPVRFYAKYGQEISNLSNITIYKNANVVDLQFNEDKNQVEKIYFESFSEFKHSVKAKVFVMCFGGIENARMLLSFNEKYNNKIGNVHDNVGRYFMEHPVVRTAHLFVEDKDKFSLYQGSLQETRYINAFFKLSEKILREKQLSNIRMPLIPSSNYTLSDGISSYHILADSFINSEVPEYLGSHLYNVVSDIDLVSEAIARRTFDSSMFDYANEFGGFEMQIMVEQAPNKNNRIKLGKTVDRLGLKKAVIDWEFSALDLERLWQSLEVVAQEVGAISIGRLQILKERQKRIWGDQMSFGNHHMGATRMAETAKEGVVDSTQKVFGTENFYIGGCSVFSTGGHVPPTLTIAAMTIRLAEHITKEYSYVKPSA